MEVYKFNNILCMRLLPLLAGMAFAGPVVAQSPGNENHQQTAVDLQDIVVTGTRHNVQ